jgi:MoxR-like ATPase
LTDEGGKRPGLTFSADQRHRPIVLITSNSERDLPDAFLRRCVYYNIDFPAEANLNLIIKRRLGLEFLTKEQRENAVRLFLKIRHLPNGLRKLPATAELLSWARVLEMQQLDVMDKERAGDLKASYSALAKNADDLDIIRSESDKLVEEIFTGEKRNLQKE